MGKYRVGQQVKVVDENSPHYERIGKIEAIVGHSPSVLYGLAFEFDENRFLPPCGRFKAEELEAMA